LIKIFLARKTKLARKHVLLRGNLNSSLFSSPF
jgi:hypothetical protein